MSFGQKCAARIVFFGTPFFASFILENLIQNKFNIAACVIQPDKPKGRKKEIIFSAVKQLAIKNNIPLCQPDNLKINTFIEKLKSFQPDLSIVASYGKIIPKTILEIPLCGNINVHGSLLPKLRGASPIAAAIKDGFNETGVTIMLMNEKMDEGPILAQARVKIEPKETSLTLEQKLQIAGAKLLINTIPLFLSGKIHPQKQNDSQATYTKIIKKEDGLINWHESADTIERKIRAYKPWPGVFTFWQGKRLKLDEAEVIAENHKSGQVYLFQKNMAIGTAKKSLLIKKIQLEGKRNMTATEFLQGYKQIIGADLPS